MPGGEGSSINLLDHHHHHRASTAATTSTTDECANGDDVKTGTSTGATFTSTMTSALAGDGLRRRKVIHAARETLDKGKSGPLRRPLSRYHRVPILRNLAQPLLSSRVPTPSSPLILNCTNIGGSILLPQHDTACHPIRWNALRSVLDFVQRGDRGESNQHPLMPIHEPIYLFLSIVYIYFTFLIS